jgi:hypothetical protein
VTNFAPMCDKSQDADVRNTIYDEKTLGI